MHCHFTQLRSAQLCSSWEDPLHLTSCADAAKSDELLRSGQRLTSGPVQACGSAEGSVLGAGAADVDARAAAASAAAGAALLCCYCHLRARQGCHRVNMNAASLSWGPCHGYNVICWAAAQPLAILLQLSRVSLQSDATQACIRSCSSRRRAKASVAATLSRRTCLKHTHARAHSRTSPWLPS